MKEKLEFKILLFGLVTIVAGILLAGFLIIQVERDNMHTVARDRLVSSARIITSSIELTMLEGDAKLSIDLVRRLKSISGFGLNVYNWQGREAFNPDAETVENSFLKSVTTTGIEAVDVEGETLRVYLPLPNKTSCRGCHSIANPVMGAVEATISLRKEYEKMNEFVLYIAVGSLLAIAIIGSVLWQTMRRGVILPLKDLEYSALKMAGGDLSFSTRIRSGDEIGRLDRSIKNSLMSISGILRKVRDISKRIAVTSEMVESESDKAVDNTMLEAEAVVEISSSVEELNVAITEIAESTAGLARAVEETVGTMQEMSKSIDSITNLTHEVSGGVEATSSSIQELSASTRQVAGNAENLAGVSDETLGAVEEIISSIKEVESRARESARLSEKATKDASTLGVSSISRTREGMDSIREHVSRAAKVIGRLEGRSEEIGNVVNVIEDIADQTTLLALNASILAAQSGEHGKGFSVVANEIKDLAERTVFSTREIDNLINTVRREVAEAVEAMGESMKSVDEGLRLSKEASGALKRILESSRKSSEMSDYIERATTEQGSTARYVSRATERVRTMVEEIARATAEQSRGVNLIITATEKMRDAARKAKRATEQQASGSRQVAETVGSISDMTRQISRAINEQKAGSNQILSSVGKIKDIPDQTRELAFGINKALRDLSRDSDLISMEMERFRLYETGDVITFGVVPFEAPADLVRKLAPLLNYLGDKTGRKFELRVAPDFDTAVAELGQGITQMCFMTSLTYIKAHRSSGARLMVRSMAGGKPFHRSAIVVRRESGIKSPADLKRRSVAFVDANSASGYLVPRAMLLDEGVDLDSLSYHNFLGSHADVAKAVLKGGFDGGGVMESTAESFSGQGLEILKLSGEIPVFNISSGPSMKAGDREAVNSALLGLRDGSPEAKAVLGSAGGKLTGFIESSDEEYDPVGDLASRLGVL